MTNNTSVGIVGGGAVGRAVAAYYQSAKIYDKYRSVDPIEEVSRAEYIFVAVPTPFIPPPSPLYQGGERRGGGQDLTEMDDAIATTVVHLKNPKEQVIVIKSTVIPGTTTRYQKKYPEVNFLFNPEFLTERTAKEDFAKPDKQLVGYTEKTRILAEKVLGILPRAPFERIMPAESCEMAKYAINAFYAFKVIFSNTIFDLCEKKQIDYNLVRDGFGRDPRIIDTHFDVMHGNYRGYGGKCLPKDVETLAWLGRENKTDLALVEQLIRINQRLKGNR